MIAQTIRFVLDDGRELEVTYDLRDVRAWEAATGRSALVESMAYEQLTYLGHHAAVRTGAINGDLSTVEAFAPRCVDIEFVRREAPGPTKGAKAKRSPRSRGAASSAPSPSEPESPSAN